MPELPEVETLRRSLEPLLLGQTPTRVRVTRRDVITLPRTSKSQPRSTLDEHLLVNSPITELRRRGKQLAILSGSGRCLVVHLGMTGQLLCESPAAPPTMPTHRHVTWQLNSGNLLTFRDPRRFGGIWTLRSRADLDSRWNELGHDALTVQGDVLAHRAGTSRRAIKAVLLDQSLLAGVGNIYADEALFRAQIRPTATAHNLKPRHWDTLAHAIRTILSDALDARGSTLRDYRDAAGQPGNAQLLHRVYGRGGQPCLVCGKTLKSATITQRTTVHCPDCQRRIPK